MTYICPNKKKHMKSKTMSSVIVSAWIMMLMLAGPVSAQHEYTYKNGKKYPSGKCINFSQTATKAAVQGKILSCNDGFPGDKKKPGKPAVHVDSMVSYSVYEGYTIRQTYSYSFRHYLQTLLTETLVEGDWMNTEQSVYTYDRKGNLLTETISYWTGTDWEAYLNLTYTYNKIGQRTSMLYEDLAGGFTELVSMIYDRRGNRIKELGKYWDGSSYVNLEMWSYTYNRHNDRLTSLGQLWDGTGWMDYQRETWTYRSKGKWLTDMVEFSDGFEWQKYLLYENTYDRFGNRLSYIGSYWYEGTGWQAEYGGVFTYDRRGNMLSNVQSYCAYWENPPYWIKNDSTALDFNYKSKIITGTGYMRAENEWVRGETNIYIPFNDNGNTLVFADEYPSNLVHVYYSDLKPGHPWDGETDGALAVTSDETARSAEMILRVSPNPVTTSFRVTVSMPVTEKVTINLYDHQGNRLKQVYQGELTAGEHHLEVASIPAGHEGVLVLRAVTPTRSAASKVIYQN